jgi:hypothetical protein
MQKPAMVLHQLVDARYGSGRNGLQGFGVAADATDRKILYKSSVIR